MEKEDEIVVMVADESHEKYVDTILATIADAAKVRGTGIARRTHDYLTAKIREAKAVIALKGDVFAGFSYIETWENRKYVTTSGLIVHPDFRGLNLSKRIKDMTFSLARTRWPKAKIFSLTSGAAVMYMNTKLGYKPVTFADLTDDGHAVGANDAHFAGGHTDLSVAVLLRHQLSGSTGGADELSALAGMHLDVVDHGTNGNVGDRQAVTGLDVGSGGRDDLVTGSEADRSDDVALLTVGVLNEGDIGAAVGVVFKTQDGSFHVELVALEIDHTVLLLVAAAMMTDGDAAVTVAAGGFLIRVEQGLLRLDLGEFGLRDSHMTNGRRRGAVCFNHFDFTPLLSRLFVTSSCRRTRWSWNLR